MAWTRKSSLPHSFSSSAKAASMLAASVTSHGTMIFAPIELASGRTRFSSASPWKVKASSAPWSWQALAMPQAIERSLATPMIRPFFPAINCAAAVMPSFLAGDGYWDKMPVVEGFDAPHIVGHDPGNHRSAGRFSPTGTPRPARAEPNDPSAMALATVGPDGTPSARMVLLKDYDAAGFVFYTNYESRKGQPAAGPSQGGAAVPLEVAAPPGPARRAGHARPRPAEADAYFASRARGSQIGAWASEQSRPLESRFALEKRVAEYGARHLIGTVPRPPHWSGFRLQPTADRILAGRRLPPARPAGIPARGRQPSRGPRAPSIPEARDGDGSPAADATGDRRVDVGGADPDRRQARGLAASPIR